MSYVRWFISSTLSLILVLSHHERVRLSTSIQVLVARQCALQFRLPTLLSKTSRRSWHTLLGGFVAELARSY
jgi:hypothetical protein